MIAYLVILSTALSTYAGAPIWTFLLGAVALTAIALSEQRAIIARSPALSLRTHIQKAGGRTAVDAVLASGAAATLGALSRFALLAAA